MNMAPELGRGERATPSVDVYALGHLLYEVVAGVHATAALFHHFIMRDVTLRRMLPWGLR